MCVGGGGTSLGSELGADAEAQITADQEDSDHPETGNVEVKKRKPVAPDEAARRSALRDLLASGGGQQSTLLTGPGGVDPTKLNLGKTLLTGA